MSEPVSIMLGGVIGALIGLFWSDPYRDSRGRFTTRKDGFGNWITQAIVGGFIGVILTSVALPLYSTIHYSL